MTKQLTIHLSQQEEKERWEDDGREFVLYHFKYTGEYDGQNMRRALVRDLTAGNRTIGAVGKISDDTISVEVIYD